MGVPQVDATELELPQHLRRRLNTFIDAVKQDAFKAGFDAGAKAERRQRRDRQVQKQPARPAGLLDIDSVKRAVARRFGIDLTDLSSSRRLAGIVHHRQIAMYLAKVTTTHSTVVLARHFGNCDRTTIRLAVRTIEQRVVEDADLRKTIGELRESLGSSG